MKPEQIIALLIVDDDAIFRSRLSRAFRDRGIQVAEADCRLEALRAAKAIIPSHAVLDLRLEHEFGMDILGDLLAISASMQIVVLTGYGTITTAVEALKRGACNYLTKPADVNDILNAYELAEQPARASKEQIAKVPQLAQVEWDYIQRVIRDHDGNISRASQALGLHRRTLQRKLSKRPTGIK